MPLSEGYGVVIGPVRSHAPDPPPAAVRRHHYQINVQTPTGVYRCVVNVHSLPPSRVQYRFIQGADWRLFRRVLALDPGFHRLAPSPFSGALDVVRHPYLRAAMPRQWTLADERTLTTLLRRALNQTWRVYIFGEPYIERLGLHNVHVAQGDPPGSAYALENGPWQDGGILFRGPGRGVDILLLKFETQHLGLSR